MTPETSKQIPTRNKWTGVESVVTLVEPLDENLEPTATCTPNLRGHRTKECSNLYVGAGSRGECKACIGFLNKTTKKDGSVIYARCKMTLPPDTSAEAINWDELTG